MAFMHGILDILVYPRWRPANCFAVTEVCSNSRVKVNRNAPPLEFTFHEFDCAIPTTPGSSDFGPDGCFIERVFMFPCCSSVSAPSPAAFFISHQILNFAEYHSPNAEQCPSKCKDSRQKLEAILSSHDHGLERRRKTLDLDL